MKKGIYTLKHFFTTLFLLALCAFFVLNFFNLLVGYFSFSSVDTDNFQILRIVLYGSSDSPEGNTVSANVSILNQSGEEIAVVERSWPESFLAIDFSTAEFHSKRYFFPEKIYGTNSVISRRLFFYQKKGTDLVPYYLENGKCLFTPNLEEQRQLFKVANFALSPISFVISSFSKKYTVNLAVCETGKYYGIFIENNELVLRQE